MMELPGDKHLSLEMIANVCHQLSSLVEAAYTPKAGAALVIKGTGETLVTKSGIQIISEAKSHHPVSKVILKVLYSFHKKTGDCSKLFLLLLNDMFLSVKYQLKHTRNEYKLRIDLISDARSLVAVIPCIFYQLREIVKQHLSSRENTEYILDIELKILLSFFHTKFPSPVATHLSSLIHECTKSLVVDYSKASEKVNFWRENFNLLCSRFVGPVDESKIIDGILFSRILAPSLVIELENASFVVFQSLSEINCCDDVLVVRGKKVVDDLIHFDYRIYESIVHLLKKNNVAVILISSIADPVFLTLCRKNNLILTDCLANDELMLLMNITNIAPLDPWQKSVCGNNIGKAKFIRTTILGNKKYLNVSPCSICLPFDLKHLALFAPLESLSKEYFFECSNSVKLVCNYFKQEYLSCNIQCMCENLQKCYLEQFPFQKITNLSKVQKYIASPNTLWEVHLCNILKLPCFKSNLVCSFLSTGILKISCGGWKSPNLVLDTSLKNINLNSPIKSEEKLNVFLEPLSNKELLVINILTVFIQLLNINEILYVERKLL